MIQLTARQETVLVLLLQQDKPLAVKDIAQHHGLSQRTIRYDLDQIKVFVKQSGGLLVKCPGVGITIQASESLRHQLLENASQLSSPDRVLSREERCEQLQQHLLLSLRAVTVEELSEQLMVSRTTIISDLQQVSVELAEAKLTLEGKRGEGYRIEGCERDLRRAIVATLEKLLPAHYAVSRNALTNSLLRSLSDKPGQIALAATYLCQVDMNALVRLMTTVREIIPFQLHSTEQLRFILYLAVLVLRVRGGYATAECSGEQVDMDSRENQLAQLIAGRLSMWFHIALGGGEIRLLSLWLIVCNVKFAPKPNDKIIQKLSAIVDDMLLVLQEFPAYNLPEFYRDKLKLNLLSHLKLTIKKYNLQISSLNTLLTQMKVNYPEIFTVSYKMAQRFELCTGIALGEDEIGFIAIHIAASVEECSRLHNKKAIIVCNTGQGAAMVLYNRICSNIPRLEILGTISALDVMEPDSLEKIDFIISTIDLPELGRPVCRVSPIITAAEMDGINSYINGNLADGHLPQNFALPAKSTTGSYEEAAVMRCAMILARLGSMAGELEQLYGVKLTTDKIFGLSIHLMMSIPRWEKGLYTRESATDPYKEEHLAMYHFIAKLLREASKECGIAIPEKEALAIMRYFVS